MKSSNRIPLLAALSIAGASLSIAGEVVPSLQVESKIESVTVYPEGARVTRLLQTDVPGGLSVLQLDFLPNQLEASQIFAEVLESSAQILVRDISLQPGLLKVEQHPDALASQAQLEEVAKALADAEQQRAVWQQRLAYARALTDSFAEGYGSREDPAAVQAQIEATWAFYEETHRQVGAQTASIDEQIADLRKQREDLDQRHAELLDGLRSALQRVEVQVEASEAGALNLALIYGVGQCSWQPVYDLRAHPEKQEVTIRYLAQVQQHSGETWEGVRLTLSTAAARRHSHIPELHPIYLNPIEPIQTRKAELRMMSMDAVGAAPMVAEMAGPQFDAGYSSFQVTLPQPFSMPSGKDRKQSVIADQTVDAAFWSVVAPAQDTQVYLAAEVTPTFEMPLLAGESLLFVGQQMVGRSYLQATPMGESIELALGVNENLTVERKPGELMEEEKGLFGKRTRLNRQYFTTVKNASSREQRIRVKDQFPVSQNEKITVNAIAPQASDVVMEEHNGRFYWDIVIPAGQSQTVETRFEVSFPEDWNVPQRF